MLAVHRLLTGVPVGTKQNIAPKSRGVGNPKMSEDKREKPSRAQVPLVNPLTSDIMAYNKKFAASAAEAPFMKSVLPVTSIFSSIKSGVQTSVTAAVKAGKNNFVWEKQKHQT